MTFQDCGQLREKIPQLKAKHFRVLSKMTGNCGSDIKTNQLMRKTYPYTEHLVPVHPTNLAALSPTFLLHSWTSSGPWNTTSTPDVAWNEHP